MVNVTIPNRYRDPNVAIVFFLTILLLAGGYAISTSLKQDVVDKENNVTLVKNDTSFMVTMPQSTPIPVNVINKNMVVDVDSEWGFYRVRGDNNLSDKLNMTLNIGDTIKFINDDSYDWSVLIHGINETPVKLRYNYASVTYKFNQSGSYTFQTQSKRDSVLSVIVK